MDITFMDGLREVLHLFNSMSPFLLFGFGLAGIMHAFVPSRLYKQHLGQPTFKSVLYSTLIAIPLPLCSCGVIPTAMSLRREGASRGSVISFLIATPQTGIDSILATYSLMGWPFAIVRPIAALVTALFGGSVANALNDKLGDDQQKDVVTVVNENTATSFWGKVWVAIKYAYFQMMQDIGRWLVLGLIIAGLITVFVPDDFFALFADNTLLSILIVLLFAIPMYICATGSIPIAIALMLKGLSPGAALVLLMAGPAVNVASMLVINKVMGWRTLLVYVGTITIGAIVFALGIDYLFPRELFMNHLIQTAACCHVATPIWQWICSGALILLLFNALIQRYFVKKKTCTACDATESTCTSTACQTSKTNHMTVVRINGMQCSHCAANVQNAISKLEGVEKVEIDLAAKTATITGSVNLDEVKTAVEAIGFEYVGKI